MAKRKVQSRTPRASKKGRKRTSTSSLGRRRATAPKARRPKTQAKKRPAAKKRARRSRAAKNVAKRPAPRVQREAAHREPPGLNRPRKRLDDVVPTPPSSLDLNRHGSAARTGRAEAAEHRADHATLTPSITAGDADVNIENAYFTGDEAPGGDNPTPDQDVVDDIGKAIGVQYQDDEELQGSEKVAKRDKHRWELDPASSEDYRDRKKQ